MSNTWVIYLQAQDNFGKLELILDKPTASLKQWEKEAAPWKFLLGDEPAAHQLVGRVMAYQGNDG